MVETSEKESLKKASMALELAKPQKQTKNSNSLLKILAVMLLAVTAVLLIIWSIWFISRFEYDYTVTNSEVTLLLYKGSKADVMIPARLLWFDVTTIGEGAFLMQTDIRSVTIPDGVTTIGDRAFAGCSALSSITIPRSVTFIGDHAFLDCRSLTSITIPDGLEVIRTGTFRNCTGLTEITIGSGVRELQPFVFSNTGLTSLTIPPGVALMGSLAFADNENLISVYFEGNAPESYGSASPFGGRLHPDLTIYYKAGKAGWTNPWFALPTQGTQ